jgi:hypothetical protein
MVLDNCIALRLDLLTGANQRLLPRLWWWAFARHSIDFAPDPRCRGSGAALSRSRYAPLIGMQGICPLLSKGPACRAVL